MSRSVLVEKVAEALRDQHESYMVNHKGYPSLGVRWKHLSAERREKWYLLAERAIKEIGDRSVINVAHQAAPFHGSALNSVYSVEERLQLALKALQIWSDYSEALEELAESVDDLPRPVCLKAPDGGGHHFVPSYVSAGVNQMICAYCSKPLKEAT